MSLQICFLGSKSNGQMKMHLQIWQHKTEAYKYMLPGTHAEETNKEPSTYENINLSNQYNFLAHRNDSKQIYLSKSNEVIAN